MFKLFLVINFLTCAAARWLHNGSFIVEQSGGGTKQTIYIAGMLGQARQAFSQIEPKGQKSIYMNFSMFGFNPKRCGAWLEEEFGLARRDVVACSVGAKPIAYMSKKELDEADNIYLLNPCAYGASLKLWLRVVVCIAGIIAEVFTYAIGWISIIPILPFPSKKDRYSLALIADQAVWIGFDPPGAISPRGKLSGKNILVIASESDGFLKRAEDLLAEDYPLILKGKGEWAIIKAGHADFGGKNAWRYRRAMNPSQRRPRRVARRYGRNG